MKKILILGLAVFAMFIFVACGKKEVTVTVPNDVTDEDTVEENKITKVERNGENLELNIISGEFVDNPNISVETGENRPTINIDYTNEKIPTYNFEVQKYKDGTNEPIKGVKFVVNGPTINNRVYEEQKK